MFEVSAILKTLRKSFSTRSAGLALLLVSATLLSAQELPPEILVETSLIVEDGAEGDSFGAALAVDGNAMVVAAPGADLDGTGTSGAVFVYTRNTAADPWTPTHNLVPDEGHFDANFLDMATVIEGDTIAVGAPYATLGGFSQEGAVYVFERNQGGADNWGQVAKLTTTASDSGAHFGGSLAIEGDLLVAGASEDGSSRNGRVTLFERDRGGANGWGEVTTLEHGVAEDAGHLGAFGSSLAIEGDLLLIGARDTAVSYLYESDGAAYLFRRNEADPDHWDFLSRLITPGADQCVGGRTLSVFWTESSPEERVEAKRCAREDISTSGDHFGTAVALSGDMIAIGANSAEGENGGDMSVGAVHLFQQDPVDPNQWNHLRKLTGSNASALAYFGGKLDLVTDTLIVGADGAAIGSSYAQGAAYVFERNAGGPEAWEEIEKLLAGGWCEQRLLRHGRGAGRPYKIGGCKRRQWGARRSLSARGGAGR